MTNVYDNAGHLERLGALARENEDLKRRLAELEKQEPVNARLLEALKKMIQANTRHGAVRVFDAIQESLGAIAAAETQQAEPVNERVIDRTWARFCGPDAPYPGMIEAFETHYGQSFRDKDWRTEAACWAAAWHKAVLVANPQAEPVRLTDEQVAKVDTAICEALGEAYDYLRGGIAWSCETMGPEDFSLVADDSDRVASIREAVLQALGLVEGAEPLKVEPVPVEAIGRLLAEDAFGVRAEPQNAKPVSLTDAVMLDLWFGDIEPVGLLSERVVRFGFKVQQALLAANGLLEGAELVKAAEPARLTDEQIKDAERYAYLRSQHEGEKAECLCVFEPGTAPGALAPVGSMPGGLDATIDAALRANGLIEGADNG